MLVKLVFSNSVELWSSSFFLQSLHCVGGLKPVFRRSYTTFRLIMQSLKLDANCHRVVVGLKGWSVVERWNSQTDSTTGPPLRTENDECFRSSFCYIWLSRKWRRVLRKPGNDERWCSVDEGTRHWKRWKWKSVEWLQRLRYCWNEVSWNDGTLPAHISTLYLALGNHWHVVFDVKTGSNCM